MAPSVAGGSSAGGDSAQPLTTRDRGTTVSPPSGQGATERPAQIGGTTGDPTSAIRNTSPITLGLLAVGSTTAAASALGAETQGTAASDIQRALVAGMNKHGGLSGRRIEPIYVTLNPMSSSYDADLSAACATFTQDHRVAAVISVLTIMNDSFEQCLADQRVIHVEGTQASPGERQLARWPMLLLPDAPTMERRERGAVSAMHGSGWLKPHNRIGVIVEACPGARDGYSRGLAPRAARLGLTVVETAEIACIRSFGEAGGAASSVQSAVLRFRYSAVDRVMFVSNFEQTLAYYFQQNAESQGYRPGYALTSNGFAGAAPGLWAESQVANIGLAGWVPFGDTSPARWPKSAEFERCRSLAAEGGFRPQNTQDVLFLATACEGLSFYAALLGRTSGDSSAGAVLRAVGPAGSSFRSAFVAGGRIGLQGHRDGVIAMSAGGYQAQCRCLVYTGRLTSID